VQAANCQPLKVLGKAKLNISLGGTTRKEGDFQTVYTFCVTEGLFHNVIIGLDFLQTHKALVDLNAKKLLITDNFQTQTVHKLTSLPSDNYEVQVIAPEDIRIPARSQVTMSAKLSEDLEEGKIEHFKPKVDDYTPMTAHTVAVIQDNTINVRVLNQSNEDIVIRCGTILGSLEDLNDDDVFVNDDDNDSSEARGQDETKGERRRTRSHHQHLHRERGSSHHRRQSDKERDSSSDRRSSSATQSDKQFVDSLDIGDNNIDPIQSARIKRLLLKYVDAFSRSPTDYGRTGIIQHHIELIGDKPKRQGARAMTPPMRQELKKTYRKC
jgi:hypothetical protein